MTLYGGKKIVIPHDDVEWDDGDGDFEDSGYECTVVQFWISPDSDDEHAIGLGDDGAMGVESLPLHVATRVADAIIKLSRWPRTKEGKAEIARMREKHEEIEDRIAAKRKAAQAPGFERPTGDEK